MSTSVAQAGDPMALKAEVKLNAHMIDALCTAIQQESEVSTDSRQLRSLGQTLYRLLFNQSEVAKSFAKRLADWRDPLIVATDEVDIPWELLHDGKDFISTRLPIGRQMVTMDPFDKGRPVGEIRRALVVSDPTEDLPAAAAESARLVAYLKARGIQCTHLKGVKADLLTVSGKLHEGGYDIFHYSGHIGVDGDGRPALRLSDGPRGQMYLAHDDIRAMISPPDSETSTNAPPIVFVNGCQSAAHMTSVCRAFLLTGSRIVVGARYRIEDDAARNFAELWYGSLLSGMTAGAAMRASRTAHSDGPNGSWAAFVLFGQPWTQLWPEGDIRDLPDPREPRDTEAQLGGFWEDHAGWFEPGLLRMIRRVTDSARDVGVVTSFHLVAVLLGEENPLSSAVESILDRTMIIDALVPLTRLEEQREALGTTGDGVVDLSDNVRRIFEMAMQKARISGRVRIGVDDVALAFIATGGGHAGELLEQLGVELSTEASLFRSGTLNNSVVAPEALRAIRCARFLSSAAGEVVSSYSLLLGMAMAGSPTFREALLDQGAAGEDVVRSWFSDGVPLTVRDFSRRAHVALKQALVDGDGTVYDAQLLAQALDDPDGTASRLIKKWGLDRDQLLASLLQVSSSPAAAEDDGR